MTRLRERDSGKDSIDLYAINLKKGFVPGRKNFDTTRVIGTGRGLLGGVVKLLLENPSLIGQGCPSLCLFGWERESSCRASTLRSEIVPHLRTGLYAVGDVGV